MQCQRRQQPEDGALLAVESHLSPSGHGGTDRLSGGVGVGVQIPAGQAQGSDAPVAVKDHLQVIGLSPTNFSYTVLITLLAI